MCTNRTNWLAITSAFIVSIHSAGAQSGVSSGLYRIVSGSYIECSGSLGKSSSSLPDADQRFVRLVVDPDPQSHLVTMTFLGADMQTVFSVVPCPPGGPISFSFFGSVSSNSMVFHVDPSPPPDEKYWLYTVTNSFNSLQIDGKVGALRRSCAEEQQFIHSNVVAVLVPPPRIRITEFSKALLFIQGPAGWTNVIEASTDLATWRPIGTNVMPYTLCPVCPYILFQDIASTNQARRFYRCFEFQ